MIQCILTCLALIILLIFVNLGISHLCGTDTSGQFKTALEGALTIFLLYLLLLTLLNHTSFAQGIPFAGKIEVYGSLTQLFHADFLVFVLECTKLISLTFLIAILSGIFTNFLPGASFGIKFIKNTAFVLVGVLIHNYFLRVMEKTVVFQWAVTALQCFLSGTALVMTPAMLLGNLLGLNPNSEWVSFLIKKLPQTKVGKAMSTATTNSLLFLSVVMIFESQYGSIASLIQLLPALIKLLGPFVIILAGLRALIKSTTK